MNRRGRQIIHGLFIVPSRRFGRRVVLSAPTCSLAWRDFGFCLWDNAASTHTSHNAQHRGFFDPVSPAPVYDGCQENCL